ncbi:aspartyl/asparaginyl beta-hydroxylase-like [Corticium candelabrum]|uniref:aspartyl/asparaginyl beta-hydroxylase-like n=1 Tax=Corticium candelabrum TaxID=121492 RepID=UPI002E276782|nr:aspartyl/asparaginyl beta-hydroxylase-like [Corticium candelabrum]
MWRVLLLGILFSSLTECKQSKTVVHTVKVTDEEDLVFHQDSDPCKVLRKYCKKVQAIAYDSCFSQLYELTLKQFTSTWSQVKNLMSFTVSFFLSCKPFNHRPKLGTKTIYHDTVGTGGEEVLQVSVRNSTEIIEEMYGYLLKASNRDAKALQQFNDRRPKLKMTNEEKLALYSKSILLLPTNLFVVDQFGLALMATDHKDLANTLFENAVKTGLWGHPMQRPVSKYVRYLPAKPWLEPKHFPFLRKLEKGYKKIKEEFLTTLKNNPELFTEEAENLHVGGNWTELRLKSSGHGFTKASESFPKTMRIINNCGQEFTSIKFSAIQANTHIQPHTGPTNERLRIHLTLIHKGGAKIRVHDEWHTWVEGKAIIFDDSWEHEVVNEGTEPRVVLIFDIWHPELPENERIVH